MATMKHILILDDDADQAELLAQVLSGPGRRVSPYADPLQALAALRSTTADLLITDLSMPWIDGQALAQEVRRVWPGLPIILISGYNLPFKEALAAEALRFFPKPLHFARLRREVAEVLGDS